MGIQDNIPPIWALILNEEVGELNRAILQQWRCIGDYRKYRQNTREEAIQVVTLALKIAEMCEEEGDIEY